MSTTEYLVTMFFALAIILYFVVGIPVLIWLDTRANTRALNERKASNAKWLETELQRPRFRLVVYIKNQTAPLYSEGFRPRVEQFWDFWGARRTSKGCATELAQQIAAGKAYGHKDCDGMKYFPHHSIASVVVEPVTVQRGRE